MTHNAQCPGCGRKHKPGHDKRVGTKLAYSDKCTKFKRNPKKVYISRYRK